jgi:hypothetical protein
MKRFSVLSMILALMLVLASCGGGSGSGSAAGNGGPEESPAQEFPELDTLEEEADTNDIQGQTENDLVNEPDPEEKEDALEQIEEEILIAESDGEVEIVDDTGAVATDENAEEEQAADEEESSDETVASDETTTEESAEESEEETAAEEEQVADQEESGEETVVDSELVEDEEDEVAEEIAADDTEDEEIEDKVNDLLNGLALNGVNMEIDLSFGRWMKVEQNRLDYYSSSEFETAKAELAELRQKVKDMREDVKAARAVVNNVQVQIKEARQALRQARQAKDIENIAYYKDQISLLKEDRTAVLNDYYMVVNARRAVVQDMKNKRDEIGYGRRQKGIYTAWANQDIIFKMDNVEKEGWYVLKVFAKNVYGNLPESYKFFNVRVKNDNTGKSVGGMEIPASVDVYQKGQMFVYLTEGENQLSLRWTNDYYVKGQYDANINISKIVLGYSKGETKRYNNGVRTANQYSAVQGRFFWSDDTVRTYWPNQTISFEYKDLEPGKYRIVVRAKNYGSLGLPDNYNGFVVDVEPSTGEAITLTIPAMVDRFKAARGEFNLEGGDTTIDLTWTNDAYQNGVYDANIEYKTIKLVRIGDYEESKLTAYLLGTQSGNRLLLILAFVTISITAAGISLFHKRNQM